ncbi:hypothetical protein VNI00_005295 [Paramarasmius palmivorus]|uniref:Transcription factor domain-containing protein n=1 Tax=Paramarasmius palmivorus TaxID=297713 RepID=A0AAW0DDY1_9AGAR
MTFDLHSNAHSVGGENFVAQAAAGSQLKQARPPECTYDDIADASAPKVEGPKSRYERLENRINELEEQLRMKENESDQKSPSMRSSSSTSSNDYPPKYHLINFESPYPNMHPSPPSQDVYNPKWPKGLPHYDHLKHLFDAPTPPRDNFAEAHASHAKEASEKMEYSGENLFEVLRTNIVLSWYYWAQSKSVEVFMMSSRTLRLAILLGLNLCPPVPSQHPGRDNEKWQCYNYFRRLQAHENGLNVHARSYDSKGQAVYSDDARPSYDTPHASLNGIATKPPAEHIQSGASLIFEAETVIEEEIRRNAFWLAYATEREQGCGNGWALSLDDQDVGQAIPLGVNPKSQGSQGMIEAHARQWMHDPHLLIHHPVDQTDSFVLYIKGTILISMVKTFNLRFRARHLQRQHNFIETTADEGLPTLDRADVEQFMEIDRLISSFLPSFPGHLRNPITTTTVDSHLYTASLMPYAATIILHDPHAAIRNVACVSAMKILAAARCILDLVHDIQSTSYDLTLLDPFCSFCWFVAGRVLARFLLASYDAADDHYVATLRAEIDFIHFPRTAIEKIGQRMPLAFRFARTLDELLNGPSMGASFSQDIVNSVLTFPRPSDPTMVIELCQDDVPVEQSHVSLHDPLYASGGVT